MTTDPLALVAAMPMPKFWLPAGASVIRSEHDLFTADQLRAARLEAAQLVLAQVGDALHAAIMNIRGRPGMHALNDQTRIAYGEGHRDARHAAAELALGGAVLAQGEPVAWIRKHPDNTLTDELLPAWQIERIRRESGAWTPLYAAPAAQVNDEVLDALRLVSMSAGWRYMTHETRAIVQAALDNARAAIASAEAASREAT